MQGQRSTVESLPEAFEFDHAPGSSTSTIEQQIYWTNVLNPTDVQTLPDYLISPSEANMSYGGEVNHDMEGLNGWNSGGSSASDHTPNENGHEESKMESGCMFSSAASARGGLRLEERRLDTARVLSLDVGINLNRTHVAEDQVFLQNSGSDAAALNVGCDASSAGGGGGGLVAQTGICPLYNPYIPQVEQVPSTSGSSNSCGTSCRVAGNLCESSGSRLGSSTEGRRLSGKRKSMEGDLGQSSGSGSHGCFQQTENGLLHSVSARNLSSSGLNVSTASENLTSVNAREEHLNPRYNAAGTRGEPSECRSSVNAEENAESSHRSFRLRINPSLAHQADASAPDWQPSLNSSRQPTIWSPHQPSPSLIPVNQSLEARLTAPSTNSQSQPQQLSVHGFPRLVLPLTRNGMPGPRIGGPSNSLPIPAERPAISREESNSRGTRRINTSEHPMFGSTTEARVVAQLPVDWSLAGSNLNMSGTLPSSSQVGSSSGAHPSITPRVHYQNLPAQHPRTLSEFVRRAFPTANSDPGVQLNNLLPQRPVHSNSPEIATAPGVGLRTHQHPLLRSAFLMDRRSGVMGAPLALRTLAASREGRSRMISEHIRNALDLMRRGENIRFEDVLILDQSAFYGLADLHDRHRDMRLDVDNMSYEELLALEERIGNVNTGLSEETILKHLKHRRHLPLLAKSPDDATVEPCCICQENYVDDEEIGTLDCGHDFHAACIKQWLGHKNLCPICKMTALVT